MHFRPICEKFLVCFIMSVLLICVITIFFFERKSIYPPPPAPASATELEYNDLLQYMGYSSLHNLSKNDKFKLDTFFSSVSLFAISSDERRFTIELLGQFQAFCRQNDLTFVLYYGAMLGAFRHHGLVPWDDDLDVMMPLSSKSKFEKLLKNHPVLAYGKKGKFVSPVFLKDKEKSQPINKHKWRWPYIEVHFYEVKKEKIVHHFESCGDTKVSDIIPVIEVPFEKMLMPAPRRMDCLVRGSYKNSETKCCTQPFSHRTERTVQKGSRCIDCKLLTSIFPFVSSRHRHGDYVDEQLFLNGKEIRKTRVKKPNCAAKS